MTQKLIYLSDGENGLNLNLSRLRPDQQRFVVSNKLHSGIVGGYQSGKSTSGAVKCISKLLHHPKVPIAYYLPTYGLFEDMLIPKMERFFEEINIDWTHNKQDSKIRSQIGEIWMRSMDNPDRIVSYSVGYSLVDEVDVVHPNKRKSAMKRISSRNSLKWEGKNCIDFVSTPEGFAYMYEFFIKNDNQFKTLYKLSTYDNEENLGDGYIQGLREQYTEEQLQAYLNGEFVNLTSGTVYRNFDRKKNVDNSKVAGENILYVGMDFNITNMAATISIKENKNRYVVDEVVNVYDTGEMAAEIKRRYPSNRIIVYPDSAGGARNTSGKSDHQILRDSGFKVMAPKKNPFVRDRINSVNKEFEEGTTFVNENKCPSLVEALEKQAYNKNGEPDKQGGFDHIVDAFGYEVHNSKAAIIKPRTSNVF